MSPYELALMVANVVILPAVSAVLGALIKGRIEDSRLFKLKDTRNVAGKWSGYFHEPGESRPKIIFDFQSRRFLNYRFWFNPKLVLARAQIQGEALECRGGFCGEEYLLLDYRNAKPEIHQFGSMLLRLHSNGTMLEGHVVGYYENLFTGNLRISKQT